MRGIVTRRRACRGRAAGVSTATISLVGLAGCTLGLDPLGHWETVDCSTLAAVNIDRVCWVDDTYSPPEAAASAIASWAEGHFGRGLRIDLGDCPGADDAIAYRCEMTLTSDESNEPVAAVLVQHAPSGDPTYVYVIVPVAEVEPGR